MANEGKNALLQQIERIKSNISDSYEACREKNATMPDVENSENLASTIQTISNGAEIPDEVKTITENGIYECPKGVRYNPIVVSVTGSVGNESVPNMIRMIDMARSIADQRYILTESDYSTANAQIIVDLLILLAQGE